jgi:dCMP deaminase
MAYLEKLMMNTKWSERFMEMAVLISSWSKDPRRKIGAIAVSQKDRRILSSGYNGFPKQIEDDGRLLVSAEKSKYVIHAEMNCIYNATYTGVSLNGASLFVHGLPVCAECAKGIIQVGIDNVYCNFETTKEDSFWINSFEQTKSILKEAGVKLWLI